MLGYGLLGTILVILLIGLSRAACMNRKRAGSLEVRSNL